MAQAPHLSVADVSAELPTERILTVDDVGDLVDELAAYHAHFAPLFTRYEQLLFSRVTAVAEKATLCLTAVRVFDR